MKLLLAKTTKIFFLLFPKFSFHRTPFQYFFVSLPCQTPKMRLADILKKRRCTNALSAELRISQIQNLPHGKAMANAHYGSLYISYLYILTAWASALLISGRWAMREPLSSG